MLRIVRVAADADLKNIYTSAMDKVRSAMPSAKIVLSVPDQSSHNAELNMVKHFGGVGFNGVEVMTFHQIARRFLKKDTGRYLDESGRMMLLYKAMCSAGLEESVFSSSMKKRGFLDAALSMICEFKRYCITPEAVKTAGEKTENKMLSAKLDAMYRTYEKYNSMFDEYGYFDSENDLSEAAVEIAGDDYFRGAYVWFAGFSDFLPQHYEVIDAMLQAGADITVYVVSEALATGEVSGIFELSEKTVDSLMRIGAEKNVPFDITSDSRRVEKAAELRLFADNYPSGDGVYTSKCNAVEITEFAGRYEETEFAAELVAELVLEDGYRYSDICVACADYSEYSALAGALFSEYKIPYFADYKMPASEQTVAALLSSVFDMAENNRSYEAVFRFLRTGLVCTDEISNDDIDMIENYVLKRGIRGDMWDKPDFWYDADAHVFDEALGEYKTKYISTDGEEEKITVPEWGKSRCFIEPISEFCWKTRGKKTAREFSDILFDLFDSIHLYEGVSSMVQKCSVDTPDTAAQYTRVWNLIVELCTQAVAVSGDEKQTIGEFGEFIQIGLSACELSIIPQGIDRVTITDFERVTDDNIKVMIVLGANHGVMPPAATAEGIFSDADRCVLEKYGIELAPDKAGRYLGAEMRMYRTLCKPVDKLYISYPTGDCAGNTLMRADFVTELCEMFPGLEIKSRAGHMSKYDSFTLSTPEVTVHKLIKLLSGGGELPEIWRYAAMWYAERGGEWMQKLRIAELMSELAEKRPYLSQETANALYGGYNKYSVSRLEEYFVCPFRYFLKNGLRLKERDVFKIGKNDIGDILHYAIETYCKTVDGEAANAAEKRKRWDLLTDEESKSIIDDIIKEVSQKVGSTVKMQQIIGRVGDVMYRSVKIINKSFKNSKYTSAGYEWKFDDLKFSDNERTVTLHGVIDRVDVYEDKARGRVHVRILDYKTGAKRFSEAEIYNKLDFQLMVYSIAAAEMYKSESGMTQTDVTGVFYNKIHNKYEKTGSADDNAIIAEEWLDGMIYCDTDDDGAYDLGMLSDYDCEIGKLGRGSYVNVRMKTNGRDLYQNSSVSDMGRIRLFSDWTKKCVLEADKNIRSGVISMLPYKRNAQDTGCSHFCPYIDVCSFDRKMCESYRELESGRKDYGILIRDHIDD